MKARIQQEPRCVLLWQVAPGSAEHAAVEHAARLSRLKVRLLTAADLGTTMEALCIGRHTGGEAAPAPDEVRRGGAVIPLRAMITPTSRSWTLAALLAELNREHEHVGGQA